MESHTGTPAPADMACGERRCGEAEYSVDVGDLSLAAHLRSVVAFGYRDKFVGLGGFNSHVQRVLPPPPPSRSPACLPLLRQKAG